MLSGENRISTDQTIFSTVSLEAKRLGSWGWIKDREDLQIIGVALADRVYGSKRFRGITQERAIEMLEDVHRALEA